MNPYDEETIAKKWTYILWSHGQLEELRQAGYIVGASDFTSFGWQQYQKQRERLLEWGFEPNLNELAEVLVQNPRITLFNAGILMEMVLRNWEKTLESKSIPRLEEKV